MAMTWKVSHLLLALKERQALIARPRFAASVLFQCIKTSIEVLPRQGFCVNSVREKKTSLMNNNEK